MHGLRKLQLSFAQALLSPKHVGASARICVNGLAPARRVQVYRNNMLVGLSGALEAVYPVIHRLVGADFFRFAAEEYIRDQPSRSGNLHGFGDRFADFLATLPAASGLPYLPDVARLEWAYHEVFHAAAGSGLDLEGLQTLPAAQWERLGFSLSSASRLLASPFPVLRIWEVNQEAYAGGQHVDLAEGAARVLVLRRDLDIRMYSLNPGEFAWLTALAEGQNITCAFEAAHAVEPDFELDACLQRHVMHGTLVDWYLASSDNSALSVT